MAKHTPPQQPFEAGESNARAVRHPAKTTGGVGVPQLPQRDAQAAGAPNPDARDTAATTDAAKPKPAARKTRAKKR